MDIKYKVIVRISPLITKWEQDQQWIFEEAQIAMNNEISTEKREKTRFFIIVKQPITQY